MLVALTAIVALMGFAFLAVPFVSSLQPSQRANAVYEMRVPLGAVPINNFALIEWGERKVFVGKFGSIRAFYMPFYHDTFMLPDPTWARPVVPCENFFFGEGVFQCNDPNLSEWWLNNSRWDSSGRNIIGFLPPLIEIVPVVKSGAVVFGASK